MKLLSTVILGAFLLALAPPARSVEADAGTSLAGRTVDLTRSDFSELRDDYRRFFGEHWTYLELAGALAAGGLLANTDMDREFQEYYRRDVRNGTTNVLSDVFRTPGEALLTVPVLVGLRLLLPDTWAGGWAQRSARAIFLGGPIGFALQRVTGGSRPDEGESNWRPFDGDNGLSGHAFLGAVPFLTAARMADDPYIKGAMYFFSALPGLSRINDEKHYLSQALLGWYLAWLSVRVVDAGEADAGAIGPVFFRGGAGLAWSSRF